jgi:hypothetical protein
VAVSVGSFTLALISIFLGYNFYIFIIICFAIVAYRAGAPFGGRIFDRTFAGGIAALSRDCGGWIFSKRFTRHGVIPSLSVQCPYFGARGLVCRLVPFYA